MGSLQITRRKSKSPQVGDMRERIQIRERAIGAPGISSAAFKQTLVLVDTVWASVETLSGEQVFNDVETGNDEKATDLFKIRYRSDVTYKTIIVYDDKNYKVLKPDDPNRRKRFLFLYCKLLGDSQYEVNK